MLYTKGKIKVLDVTVTAPFLPDYLQIDDWLYKGYKIGNTTTHIIPNPNPAKMPECHFHVTLIP